MACLRLHQISLFLSFLSISLLRRWLQWIFWIRSHQHLNNASVVEILDNAGWEALTSNEITPANARFTICDYDIEYSDSPRFGEQLEILNWFDHSQHLDMNLQGSSA